MNPNSLKVDPSRAIAVVSIFMLLALWYVIAIIIDSDVLPSPLDVFVAIYHAGLSGELFYHTGVTLWRVVASFVISMFVGIAIGFAMGYFRRVDALFDSWLIFFLNIPALVVMILAYIWLGLTEVALIVAVAVNKIPNVVVTIREGVRAMDSNLREMTLVYGFGKWKTLRYLVLPELRPYIAAASRSGIALIWKIVLVAELLGRSDGVGFQLHLQFQLFNITEIIAWGLVFVIIMQLVEALILRPFEAYANRWRR